MRRSETFYHSPKGLRRLLTLLPITLGGSIRSPAANNGVFGLRPTAWRLPVAGWAGTQLGEEQVVPVIGPLSTSIEGIKVSTVV